MATLEKVPVANFHSLSIRVTETKSGVSCRKIVIYLGDSIIVGRSKRKCDVVFDDCRVSRIHCEVKSPRGNGNVFIRESRRNPCTCLSDCKCPTIESESTNGTYLNGKRLTSLKWTKLTDGVIITFSKLASRAIIGFRVQMLKRESIITPCKNTIHKFQENLNQKSLSSVLPGSTCAMVKNSYGELIIGKKDSTVDSSIDIVGDSESHEAMDSFEESEECNSVPNNLSACHSRNCRLQETGNKPQQPYLNDSLLKDTGFCLNRLAGMSGHASPEFGVTMAELLHPVGDLEAVFTATFTLDLPWFLEASGISKEVDLTVSTHNADVSWNRDPCARVSFPYPEKWPNLRLLYPLFPDSSRWGSNPDSKGMGCHHPKFFLLFRKTFLRVIISSANLNSHQWLQVTNTIWWQDFRPLKSPNFEPFCSSDSSNDFAVQLAYLVGQLTAGASNTGHDMDAWLHRMSHYDFSNARVALLVSCPGLQWRPWEDPAIAGRSSDLIGSFVSSVMGMSHVFHSSADDSAQNFSCLLKVAGASKSTDPHPAVISNQESNEDLVRAEIRHIMNNAADSNAIAVSVPLQGSDGLRIGFLPRPAAKWLAPLLDARLVAVSGWIDRLEALQVASGQSDSWLLPIRLLLKKGPLFDSFCALDRCKEASFLEML